MKRAVMTEGRSKAFDFTIPVPMGFSVSFAIGEFEKQLALDADAFFSDERFAEFELMWGGT